MRSHMVVGDYWRPQESSGGVESEAWERRIGVLLLSVCCNRSDGHHWWNWSVITADNETVGTGVIHPGDDREVGLGAATACAETIAKNYLSSLPGKGDDEEVLRGES